FAIVVSAVTSVICGLAPALQSSSTDLVSSMREAGRGLSGSTRQAVLRKTLVVVEVALALMLLAGSSLLVRTYAAMQNVEWTVPPERLLTMRVPLPATNYPDAARRIAFFNDLLPRVAAVPGVEAVGLNTGLHPVGNWRFPVEVSGMPANTEPVMIHQINPTYTTTLGIRLGSGRLFTDSDVISNQRVALVNERFVRTRLENRPPLGQVVRLPGLKQPPFALPDVAFLIVGVVHDTLNQGLAEPTMPEIFLPFSTTGFANLLVVRTRSDPASVSRAVVGQVYAIDKNQPVMDVKALDVVLKDSAYARPRFNLTLLGVLAAVGMMLAIVGVYGVMSTAVAQQRHEIGVRMALGASAGSIARMVITRGSWLLGIGIVLGLIGASAVARLLARQVWNVAPFDPLAFAVVSLILLLAGLQACFWPARRASRIDPIIALREEQ
ncbi:MAG TPA: FtsX-like permease family protein, partial [Vicinamibacterales bacterium]|nr:FtsX-like permease family protein [Vicinamibacterales bacterium]